MKYNNLVYIVFLVYIKKPMKYLYIYYLIILKQKMSLAFGAYLFTRQINYGVK